MTNFWNKKAQDMTVKDTLVFTGVITGVTFVPFAVIAGVNKFSEWRAERRWRKEHEDKK